MSGIARTTIQPVLPVIETASQDVPAMLGPLYRNSESLQRYLDTQQQAVSRLYDTLARSINDRHMVGTSAEKPTAAEAGRQYFVNDATPKRLEIDDGSSWQTLPVWSSPLATTLGGTGLTSYTTGDLLYASATNVLSRLAKGTNGYFLQQGVSIPAWFNLFGTANIWTNQAITYSPAATSGTFFSLVINHTTTPTGSSTEDNYGVFAQTTSVGSNNLTSAIGLYGLYGKALHNNTGTATGICGVYGMARKEYTGPVTNAYGLYSIVQNVDASGAIATGYGLYVDSFTRTGTITTSYGVYVADTIAKNYFANNVGIGTTTFGTSAAQVLGIGNGTEPSTSPVNMIQMYSKDSSAGSANATLGLRTEQGVETIGTFEASHKLRVWINGQEFWVQLDAV